MQDFSLSRFFDLAMVGAIMRISLYVCAAGAASLAARFALMRGRGAPYAPCAPCASDGPGEPVEPGEPEAPGDLDGPGEPDDPDAAPDAVPCPAPLWAVVLSWLAVLSPAAPVMAFVILFEIEAAQAFLVEDCNPGGDCLTRVLVWPAFLFVGLGVLAACVSLARGLRRRLGGAALWPLALAPLVAGALAAFLGR